MAKKTSSKKTKVSRSRSASIRRSPRRAQSMAPTQDFSVALQSSGTMNSPTQTSTSFNQMAMMWVVFMIVNTIIIFLANMFFPQHVALGTYRITSVMGLLLTSAVLSIIIVGALPIIELVGQMMKTKVSDSQWMVIYLIINTVAVWLLGRMAEITGMGVSSWVAALLLGFVLNFVQGIAWKMAITPLTSRVA